MSTTANAMAQAHVRTAEIKAQSATKALTDARALVRTLNDEFKTTGNLLLKEQIAQVKATLYPALMLQRSTEEELTRAHETMSLQLTISI